MWGSVSPRAMGEPRYVPDNSPHRPQGVTLKPSGRGGTVERMRHASLVVGAVTTALVGCLVGCGDDTSQASSGSGAAGPGSTTSGTPGGGGPGGAGPGGGGGTGGMMMMSNVNCDPPSGTLGALKLT